MTTQTKGYAMLGRDTLISKTITVLRWPLAFLVVADHYFRYGMIAGQMTCSPTEVNLICTIEAFIISFLKNYPVPVFFFISGFLLYLGDRPANYYRIKLRKLPREIIFPYLFWTVFAIVIFAIYRSTQGASVRDALAIPAGGNYLPGEVKWLIKNFIGTPWPANLPLWYVRDLLLLIIVSPILHYLLKWSKGWILVLFGALYIVFNNDNVGLRFLTGLFFFSTGYWVRYMGIDILRVAGKCFIPAMVIYLTCAGYYFVNFDMATDDTIGMPLFNCILKNIAVIAFLPLIFHLVSRGIAKKRIDVNPMLASASFFVYVTHYPIKHAVVRLCEFSFGGMPVGGLIALMVATIATTLLLTAVYLLLKRYLPRFMRVIDGR
ncbi:MAG: acyltransferase [Muribaculaceae bacterium]|nr:acyltransferase [Muribaculaceae bacterium]